MPSSRSFAARSLAYLLLTAALFIPSALRTSAQAGDRTLLLAVELNGRPLDVMVEVEEHGKSLSLPGTDLAAIGLRRQATGDRVSLGELPGLRYRIDERRQTLVIQAEDSSLLAQQLREGDAILPIERTSTGAVLNYNLLGTGGTANSTGAGINGLFELRGHSPYGTLSSSALMQHDLAGNAGGLARQTRVVRLDTVLADTEIDSMRRWRLGDVITTSLAWTRPIRLGGMQVTSDFSIRPDLVTFPVPELGGRAGVPSTVDVLVNGVRQLSQQVQPGPFELRQPPVVTGAGDIAVVVRDATGRETIRTLSFYASPAMLKPGLWSYGLEGGLVRTGYGIVSNGYRKPALNGTARYGVLDWLTAEAHVETAAQVQMAGGGVAVDIAGQALLSASVAGSVAGRRNGGQASLGIERTGRVLSISASVTQATRGFRDVPSVNGTPVPTRSMQLGFGLSMGNWGSLHGAYLATNRGLLTSRASGTGFGTRAAVVSASYSRPLTETTAFYATSYRDLAAHGAMGINLGFSIALGPRTSANVASGLDDSQPGGTLGTAQAAVLPGDFGWRVNALEGRNRQQQAEASTILPWGTASLGGEHVGRGFNARGGLQGALVLAGGDLFATNRVEDSFAVVDTNGLAGVDVLRENRPVGRTNSQGRLLVPDLRGWDANRISIDPSTMPGDVELGSLNQIVRPLDHSGVNVRFTAKRGRSAVVHLVDAAQRPLLPGSTARLQPNGRSVPVGFGGEVFLIELADDNTLEVITVSGACTARFAFVAQPGEIPLIDSVACERNKP